MNRAPVAILAVVLACCGDQSPSKSIDTPRGTVTYKERVQAEGEFKGTVRSVSSSEATRLKEAAARAPDFIAQYVGPAQRQEDLLDNLDIAFAAWLNSSRASKESASEVEWIVGAALGEYCIARLPVRWAVGSDDQGTEYMIIGDDPPVRSYPLAAVRYRIEDGKTGFIGAVYEALVHVRRK